MEGDAGKRRRCSSALAAVVVQLGVKGGQGLWCVQPSWQGTCAFQGATNTPHHVPILAARPSSCAVQAAAAQRAGHHLPVRPHQAHAGGRAGQRGAPHLRHRRQGGRWAARRNAGPGLGFLPTAAGARQSIWQADPPMPPVLPRPCPPRLRPAMRWPSASSSWCRRWLTRCACFLPRGTALTGCMAQKAGPHDAQI